MNNIANNPSRNSPPELSRSERRERALRSVFPLAFDTTPDIPIKEKDYQKITYWHQREWTDAEKARKEAAKKPDSSSSTKSSYSIGVHLRFLEDENGITVTKARLNEMRLFLHRAFTELEKIMPEIIPTSWKTHAL
ncbi:hypothetical protein M378DRAFT_627708 [Amanita muscaria Koide BX008]|uniref:Uncharacterized protein n=1 Tax=Amanita muscaria (strain Koide BX008) TaxID=946122 RepID=A0A0C2X4I7_AMAMK|nr:hypothetical protein M378DRAFT_627708 [Amanita muscaria Koide BX008]